MRCKYDRICGNKRQSSCMHIRCTSRKTSRKTLIVRNTICDALKRACSTKLFLWRMQINAVVHLQLVRHRNLPFCGACAQVRHRKFVGPTRVHHSTWAKGILWRMCHMRHRKSKFCGACRHMDHRISSFRGVGSHIRHRKLQGFFLPTQLNPLGSPFLAL
jgi:hypothetical protein